MKTLVIIAFGELSDEDWKETVAAEEKYLRERIASYDGGPSLEAEVAATNIGRGADWMVLAVSFGLAAIVIPQAHKRSAKVSKNGFGYTGNYMLSSVG